MKSKKNTLLDPDSATLPRKSPGIRLKESKKVESRVLNQLRSQSERRGWQFQRYYDSFSAQGFHLPAQFSDAGLLLPGAQSVLLEVKHLHEGVEWKLARLKAKQLEGFRSSAERGWLYGVILYVNLTQEHYLVLGHEFHKRLPNWPVSRPFDVCRQFEDRRFKKISLLLDFLGSYCPEFFLQYHYGLSAAEFQRNTDNPNQ